MNLGSSSLGSVELGGVNAQPIILGTLIITLDDATFSGTGSLAINGTLHITLSDVGFVFRGRVAQPPPPGEPASSACIPFDTVVEFDGLESDALAEAVSFAFDNLDIQPSLAQDVEVDLKCPI